MLILFNKEPIHSAFESYSVLYLQRVHFNDKILKLLKFTPLIFIFLASEFIIVAAINLHLWCLSQLSLATAYLRINILLLLLIVTKTAIIHLE